MKLMADELSIIADSPISPPVQANEPPDYSQKALDAQLRPEMIEAARMSVGDLVALVQDVEQFNKLPAFKASWIKALLRAVTAGEMQAVSFVQEHLVGKAIQRVQTENVSYTYQDLLHRIKEKEARYQIIVNDEPSPKTWSDLL
jgi:hypothetical protein